MKKSYNINRRKFLEVFGCSCCGFFTASCGTVPITERKQLTIYPESAINRQAAKAYEKLKNSKGKVSPDCTSLFFRQVNPFPARGSRFFPVWHYGLSSFQAGYKIHTGIF